MLRAATSGASEQARVCVITNTPPPFHSLYSNVRKTNSKCRPGTPLHTVVYSFKCFLYILVGHLDDRIVSSDGLPYIFDELNLIHLDTVIAYLLARGHAQS